MSRASSEIIGDAGYAPRMADFARSQRWADQAY
jgi:hypothetical protein